MEAEKAEPELAAGAFRRIEALYEIEKRCTAEELDVQQRLAVHREGAQPLLDELFSRMALREAEVLPKGPGAAALRSAIKLDDALRRDSSDGRHEIDNNRAERAMRRSRPAGERTGCSSRPTAVARPQRSSRASS